ncbi:pro-resilin-like [Cylas formicarius]|uniref:pro-resilin-like n=1 Tax=Cylas formicarius TaxID=197179 RepID=UPI002958A873|nr:pro-resilin-like [Cylas formicarius]
MKHQPAIFFICAIIIAVRSEAEITPSRSYGVPQGGSLGGQYGAPRPQQGYGSGDHGDGHGSTEPQAYEFGYRVKDDYSGSNFHQQEQSDGNQVRGEYKVHLPDGRTQIVSYWADWKTGFHADVRYEGQAKFPPAPPRGQYGAPSNGQPGGGYNYQKPSSQYGAPN